MERDWAVEPFQRYPKAGRELLGRVRGANARHEYGLELARSTGVTNCGYCGVDFVNDYYYWLLLQVDHVVPVSVAATLGIPDTFYQDTINLVLACSGCNSYKNRFVHTADHDGPWSLESFVELRDAIFLERSGIIAARRQQELTFFQNTWLTLHSTSDVESHTRIGDDKADRRHVR
jgi:5-methylcytosine-specific restriction endonuclease McrA